MPNWVDQEFAITGPAADIDRFCALAVTGNFRRDHTLDDEPLFLFSKVCPIKPPDRRACADEHVDGVLFRFARTQIQAHFNIQTSWDFPRHFYLQRLLRDWPRLSFCCAINEDMSNFGGVVAGFEGIVVNAVEDYDADNDRKAHARQVRSVTTRWDRLLRAERSWRAARPLEYRRLTIYKAPATFDDLGWHFYFTTEKDCRRFAKRYKGATVQRQVGRGGRRCAPGRRGRGGPPAVSRGHPVGEGVSLMNNAELVSDFTRTVEVEGEVYLQVAVVEWPEPGSPTMVWKTFGRWKRQPKPERLVAAQQKAATVPVFALCASGSRVTASSVIANFLPARESYRPAAVLPEGEFRESPGRAIRLVVVGRERGARQFVEPLAIPRAAHDIRHEEPAAREFVQARAHDAAPTHGL